MSRIIETVANPEAAAIAETPRLARSGLSPTTTAVRRSAAETPADVASIAPSQTTGKRQTMLQLKAARSGSRCRKEENNMKQTDKAAFIPRKAATGKRVTGFRRSGIKVTATAETVIPYRY